MVGLYEVQPEESDIDWLGMSPLGNWVLIGGMEGNEGNLVGLTLADRRLERNWLDRTNVLIQLDRESPRAFYLSKIYNTTEAYWEETHGAMSNDGSRIVWASNWNLDPGAEDVFLLQLDMPLGWRELAQ